MKCISFFFIQYKYKKKFKILVFNENIEAVYEINVVMFSLVEWETSIVLWFESFLQQTENL
jgi:hypothetical protein